MVAFRLGILLSVVCFSTFSSAELATLTLVGKSGKITSPTGIFIRSVLEKSYAELGYDINYIPVPLGRSLIEVNSGRIDGFLTRTGSITEEYPNLVKVPFSLLQSYILLLTNPKVCGQCTISQLSNVATVKGFKAFEYYMTKNAIELNLVQVVNHKQMFGMLAVGRVDGVVLPHQNPNTLNLKGKWTQHILDTYSSYHYVHKKHLKLVPRLRQQFEILQKTGEMKRLFDHAFNHS
jgi:hypothetical protein